MFNASRKGEAIDRFGVLAQGIIKEKIKESFKVSFCSCAPMHVSGCLTNMTQIYAWTPLEWVGKDNTLCPKQCCHASTEKNGSIAKGKSKSMNKYQNMVRVRESWGLKS